MFQKIAEIDFFHPMGEFNIQILPTPNLPARKRVAFKIAILVFQCLTGIFGR